MKVFSNGLGCNLLIRKPYTKSLLLGEYVRPWYEPRIHSGSYVFHNCRVGFGSRIDGRQIALQLRIVREIYQDCNALGASHSLVTGPSFILNSLGVETTDYGIVWKKSKRGTKIIKDEY